MLPIESLHHPFNEALGWTLIHFLWQGTLVGIVAAIVLAAMRHRTASARYLVSIMSLAAMAICPMVTAGLLVAQIPTVTPVVVNVKPSPVIETTAPTTQTPLLETATTEVATLAEQPAPSKPTPPQTAPELSLSERIDQLAPWITAAWFVGAALLSLRLLFSWFQVIRITRFGLKPVDDAIQQTFDSLCERMGLRRIVRVFESTLIGVPATVGWLRPIVLLPATAITGLSEEQLIAVLAHELAHVRRYDYVVNLAQGVVETLLFYHPAVWLLSKRIRTERENCCDDAAVEITGEPVEYVRALTQLAQPTAVPKLATAATGGELAARARRLLGRPANDRPPKTAGLVGIIALLLLSLVITSTAATIEADEDQTLHGTIPGDRFPLFVFAKCVTLRDGKIVTLDDALEELDELKRAKTPGLHVYFTSGLSGERQETFNRFTFSRQMPIASIRPEHRRPYDDVRATTDIRLRPERKRVGRLLSADGTPVEGAAIAVVAKRERGTNRVFLTANGTIKNPGYYEVVRTNDRGEFALYPEFAAYELLAIHRKFGVAVVTSEDFAEQQTLRLKQWSTVAGRVVVRKSRPESLALESVPAKSVVLSIDIPFNTEGRFEVKRVPPFNSYPMRAIQTATIRDGELAMRPGESKRLFLRPLTRDQIPQITDESFGDVEVGNPEPAIFEAFDEAAFARARKLRQPILVEFAEPNDASAKAIRDRLFNREYIIDEFENREFRLMRAKPKDAVRILGDLIDEDSEAPRYALFSRNPFEEPEVVWDPPKRNADFMASLGRAAAIPKGEVVPFLVAKHAIIFEGRVVEVKQLAKRVRELAEKQLITLHESFTPAAEERRFEIYPTLFPLKKELGFNWKMSPLDSRISARWDKIRTDEDLIRQGKKVTVRVLNPDGQVAATTTTALLLPNVVTDPVKLAGYQLATPYSADSALTPDGKLSIRVPDDVGNIVLLNKTGFAVFPRDDFMKSDATLRLSAWAKVTGDSDRLGAAHDAVITSKPNKSGITFKSVQTDLNRGGDFRAIIPPGEITVSRSVRLGKGQKHEFSVETVQLKPGESHQLALNNIPQTALEQISDMWAEFRKKQEAKRKARQKAKQQLIGNGEQAELNQSSAERQAAKDALVRRYYDAFVKRQTGIKQSGRPLNAMLKALDDDQTTFANFKIEWEKIGGPIGNDLRKSSLSGEQIDTNQRLIPRELNLSIERLRTELKKTKRDLEHFSRVRDELTAMMKLTHTQGGTAGTKPKLSNTPTWIIAKHVIIFEGKHVVEWDHVVDSLATLATREGKVKASFQFTPGARDKFQSVQQDIFKAMKGLPRDIPMSIGSGGIASHDNVRTQADLDPDPKLRIVARALQPDGKPASEADVAIIPPLGKKNEHYIYLSGTQLRNKLEHDYQQAKKSGGFVVHPKEGSTVFVTHKSGYALIAPEELRKQPTIRLTPWVTVKGKVFESPGHEQRLTLSTRPRKHFLFMFYDIVVDAEGNYEAKVPAGEVAASRSVKAGQGTSFGTGVATWTLKSGETKSFDLKPMTEYEIEGFELQKKHSAARRGGPPLSAEDEKRLLERLKIDLEKRRRKQQQQAQRKVRGRVVWEGPIPRFPDFQNLNRLPDTVAKNAPDNRLVVDRKSRGVGHVFIYLRDKPDWYEPDNEVQLKPVQHSLVQNDFSPRSLIVRTGQQIELLNKMPIAGNWHVYPMRNISFNMAVRPNDTSGQSAFSYKKPERYPIRVGSDFYNWMRAYHLPLDHPFAAVTDRDGRFAIEGLPPGEHAFYVWHEEFGRLPKLRVSVPSSDTTQGKLYRIVMSSKAKIEKLQEQHDAAKQKYGEAHPSARRILEEIRLWQMSKSDKPKISP